MRRLPVLELRKLVKSVEIISHELVEKKIELLFLKALRQLAMSFRCAPKISPWIVIAINELVVVGALQFYEVSPLILQNRLQIRLDVYFRPLEVDVWESGDSDESYEEEDDVLLVDTEDWFLVDLTNSTDEEEHNVVAIEAGTTRKRRYGQRNLKKKRQRLSNGGSALHDESFSYYIDTMDFENDENDNYTNFNSPQNIKASSSFVVEPPIHNERIGIFCPLPFRKRLLNAIITAMDDVPDWQQCPQFKRNGYKLDTVWFVPADKFSKKWLISTVKDLSKQPAWHRAGLVIEPWSPRFVMRNILQFSLPWKPTPGNGKSKVVQRLRKANKMHGSHRWNLIGCRLVDRRINVFMAVNDQTIRSLKPTQFNVYYGFSRYRCQVMDTVLEFV